ncbi:uncharacterized protein LOC116175604 [Photinus pyralis]|nr:uncharacterized protein LOC116175604 [Photinus pyralis]
MLWVEIHNLLGGAKSVDEIKAKWKYLRDCYLKAKRKMNQYKPSGSAAAGIPDPRFRHFSLMKFLDDSSDRQPTVSSLPASPQSTSLQSTVSTPRHSPSLDSIPAKRKKSEDLQRGILEALTTPTTNDGVDGILIRIGDSLRRFPYRDRTKLEIDILQMIYDRECELNL